MPADFSIARDNYGAPRVVCGPRAEAVLGRHRIGSIAVSMTHDRGTASAVAQAERAAIKVPFYGRLLYRFLPFRRTDILENLRRVYGDTCPEDEIVALAQAHYGHLLQLLGEFVHHRFMSAKRKAALVRVENYEAFAAALQQGKGVLILTGHFGNWEVATIAGLAKYPSFRGKFHFVRRAFKPRWLDAFITRRFHQAGFGVIGKRGSLDRILDLLAAGDVIVFPFDQHAAPPGRHRGRILLASGLDVPEPRDHRARHGRAGALRRRMARGRQASRVALRRSDRAGRSRGHERSDPPHDARVQRRARAPRPRPAGAVVLGASAVEGFRRQVQEAPLALGRGGRAALGPASSSYSSSRNCRECSLA